MNEVPNFAPGESEQEDRPETLDSLIEELIEKHGIEGEREAFTQAAKVGLEAIKQPGPGPMFEESQVLRRKLSPTGQEALLDFWNSIIESLEHK